MRTKPSIIVMCICLLGVLLVMCFWCNKKSHSYLYAITDTNFTKGFCCDDITILEDTTINIDSIKLVFKKDNK